MLLIGLVLLLLPQSIVGANAMPTHTELKQMSQTPLPLLLSKAQEYYETHPDSAIIYYTATANKYNTSLSQEECKMCLTAAIGMWEIAFFNYFDYSSAFEHSLRQKK